MNELQIKEAFEKRLGQNYGKSVIGWLKMSKSDLISAAAEIAAAEMLVSQLPEALTTEQMEYLLQFENPLAVMCDAWMFEDGVDHSKELKHTAQGMMEQDNPVFASPERGPTLC